MKTIISLLSALILCGCQTISTFVEEHPKSAGIAFAVAVAALAASQTDDEASVPLVMPKPPCTMQPDGSCR